jgi:pyruvate/2-oxoglutarate dehydrogenase complex dihydrolipoamide acyltransferase (E2) component
VDAPHENESLDYAERWLRDGLAVLRPALSVHQIQVDMTEASKRLDTLRRSGAQANYTHLLVRATAVALARNRAFHQVIAGSRRHRPSHVNIGLSVSGDTFVAPVMVIERANEKSVEELVEEIARRVTEVRDADRQLLSLLRRWGWLVPFGWMRRGVLRALFTSPTFRMKGAGTFQVSTVPADWALTSTFATAGVLVGGQVASRVIAMDGHPVVRPIMAITLSGDHTIWDGRAAARFLATVKSELETTFAPAG